jgi:Rrf2 family iron-sulfur cluster assembly transcriptional regulator
MRITTKGRYALRAAIALAEMSKNGEMISINSLSDAEDISSVFLEQIFFKLKKAGIVKSVRGPGGGFSFARPPENISVREVLYFAGEELDVLPCDRQGGNCERMSECICHKMLTSVTDLINDYFNGVTLKMLLVNKEFRPGKKPDASSAA